MSTQHTPEPLAVSYVYHEALGLKMYFDSVCVMALCRPSESFIETARRIVACVNACAGMEDPAAEIDMLRAGQLPDYGLADLCGQFESERDKAMAQCRELIKALEDARNYIDDCGAQRGAQKAIDDIDSAIAKARGNQS